MEIIRTYSPDSKEYATLRKAAGILTSISPKGKMYYVGDCYFDLGQNWMYTAILCSDEYWGDYQALCPRDYEKVLTYDNLLTAIDEIVHDKYWNDKEETKAYAV